jgi:hypothetical protein
MSVCKVIFVRVFVSLAFLNIVYESTRRSFPRKPDPEWSYLIPLESPR